MALEFDALLESLHQNKNETKLIDAESNPIVVNERRDFIVPEGYNTAIAYEGDVNSQIITFDLPVYHEGHNLANCNNKILYWKNLQSGIEGSSDLDGVSIANERQILQWIVPPEAFTQAGVIEISISIYDIQNSRIAFAWNTASFAQLTVEKTMGSVNHHLPARDQILLINEETRQIVAPSNYNNIVGFQGDKGVGKVYFIIKRHISGIDVLQPDATITIFYRALDIINTSVLMKSEYTPEIEGRNQEGMVLLTWTIPDADGSFMQIYNGKFDISLKIETLRQTWHTNTYSNLEIKPSLTSANNGSSENINEYLQNAHWKLNGNVVSETNSLVELPGVVSLRTYTENIQENNIVDNELLPQYDNDGKLFKLFIKTKNGLVNIYGAADLLSGEYIIDAGTATELID